MLAGRPACCTASSQCRLAPTPPAEAPCYRLQDPLPAVPPLLQSGLARALPAAVALVLAWWPAAPPAAAAAAAQLLHAPADSTPMLRVTFWLPYPLCQARRQSRAALQGPRRVDPARSLAAWQAWKDERRSHATRLKASSDSRASWREATSHTVLEPPWCPARRCLAPSPVSQFPELSSVPQFPAVPRML